jgi:peptidyl-prolyl cis-trans isomerase C
MVPPFSEAVEEMEKGAVSTEPVETGFGWHVILLEDVRETPPPPFEAVEDELRSELRQARIQNYVSELREDADIQVQAASPGPAGEAAADTPEQAD